MVSAINTIMAFIALFSSYYVSPTSIDVNLPENPVCVTCGHRQYEMTVIVLGRIEGALIPLQLKEVREFANGFLCDQEAALSADSFVEYILDEADAAGFPFVIEAVKSYCE